MFLEFIYGSRLVASFLGACVLVEVIDLKIFLVLCRDFLRNLHLGLVVPEIVAHTRHNPLFLCAQSL
jgi:hypothetical protein